MELKRQEKVNGNGKRMVTVIGTGTVKRTGTVIRTGTVRERKRNGNGTARELNGERYKNERSIVELKKSYWSSRTKYLRRGNQVR